jgi:hypothetical protein
MKVNALMVALLLILLSTAALAGEVATQAPRADMSSLVLAKTPVSGGPKTDVPQLMSFTGSLQDTNGVALDTTVSMTFSIYIDSGAVSPIWNETQPAVEVKSGLFNILLGSVNAIVDTIFQDPERWLGVQVGGDPESIPRQRIASVAYAFWAAEADTAEYARSSAGGGAGGWLDDGTVVRLETDTDSVGIGTSAPAAKLDVRGTLNVGRDEAGYDVNFYGDYSNGRFFWDQEKMALRAGLDYFGTQWTPDSVGWCSAAMGLDCKASGVRGAFAMGYAANASGDDGTTAMGYGPSATGRWGATAMGRSTTASGDNGATAMGYSTTASGYVGATAMGMNCLASGDYGATAMGNGSAASGRSSIALGQLVKAGPADYTITLGRGTTAGDTLVNNIENSLMVGFDTGTPTLFVGGPDHRVGIGTSIPSAQLEVISSSGSGLRAVGAGGNEGVIGTAAYGVYGNTSTTAGVFGVNATTLDFGYLGGVDKGVYGESGSGHAGYFSGKGYFSNDVGIGATVPEYKLDVRGDRIQLKEDATGDWIAMRTDGGALDIQWDGGNLYMGSATDGEHLLLNPTNASSNVGIGTTGPSAKLDVDGEINTSSLYKIGGTAVLSTPSSQNTFLGLGAGASNTSDYGTFVGYNSGNLNQGQHNTFLGRYAGYSNVTGQRNTFVASNAGRENTSGENNVFVGYDAGRLCNTGSNNVFLGYQAGQSENGSHKLYIDNTSTTDPLVYGEFDSNFLAVNGDLTVDGEVGIGTETPNGPLHVQSDVNIATGSSFTDREAPLVVGDGLNPANGAILIDGNQIEQARDDDRLYLNYSSGADIIMAMGGGNVGVGISSPSNPFEVDDSGYGGYMGNGRGVSGYSSTGNTAWLCSFSYSVVAHVGSPGFYAGLFDGDVSITGTLYGGKGSTVVDHPLDPANKLLCHNLVESPENLLIYRGRTQLNAAGEATVEMPRYFEALTKEEEASIHLTPVGRPFLTGADWNSGFKSFMVYGDPGREVFWEVLVSRDDPVIHQLAQEVEQDKGPDKICDRGVLLYPEAHGYPESMSKWNHMLKTELARKER